MPFATNNDLVKYFPTAMDHGVADWSAELAMAQGDVETIVKTRWFNQEFGTVRSRSSVVGLPTYDATKLTSSQWTRATCYRALAVYILSKLSTFRPEGDSFREQLAFFQSRFEEEMNLQFGAGVEYDLDDDGTVETGEKFAVAQDRLYR
jgi:hypothetical protein